MSDVFYLRNMGTAIAPADIDEMLQHAGGCFDLHRVTWYRSFLAADGDRMLCWYQSPDAESVRMAMRDLGSDLSLVWPGQVSGPTVAPPPGWSEVRAVLEIGEATDGDGASSGPDTRARPPKPWSPTAYRASWRRLSRPASPACCNPRISGPLANRRRGQACTARRCGAVRRYRLRGDRWVRNG